VLIQINRFIDDGHVPLIVTRVRYRPSSSDARNEHFRTKLFVAFLMVIGYVAHRRWRDMLQDLALLASAFPFQIMTSEPKPKASGAQSLGNRAPPFTTTSR